MNCANMICRYTSYGIEITCLCLKCVYMSGPISVTVNEDTVSEFCLSLPLTDKDAHFKIKTIISCYSMDYSGNLENKQCANTYTGDIPN